MATSGYSCWWMISGLFLALALSAGCQDRLAYENFSMIREDASTVHEVTGLLGDPDARRGNQWMYERPGKRLCVFVDFAPDGRVHRKQWFDSKNSVWVDTGSCQAGWSE